jgi:hypothetical protein
LDEISRLAEPTGGKFAYPYSKRRTKDTVNALRQAESNLDAVWTKIDEWTIANDEYFEVSALYGLLSEPRALRRTAEWVEPEETTEEVKTSLDKDLLSLDRPLSNLFLGESGQETQKFDKSVSSKTKPKTRGEPSKTENNDTTPAEVPEPQVADSQPTFAVDARALKVFRTLFFDPEVTTTPGLISWSDFLYAMASTGFKIQKLYGSVWQLTPTKLDVERSIHFHEPHPKGKIPFEIARRHGRRLTRAYGWVGEMFVLEEK